MTAIGDLGFSDGEIRKLFDFWDMDGSGGIDFYECVALRCRCGCVVLCCSLARLR